MFLLANMGDEAVAALANRGANMHALAWGNNRINYWRINRIIDYKPAITLNDDLGPRKRNSFL